MKVIISGNLLKKAAATVISNIKRRTSEGKDKEGRPFQSYSRKPFGMPAGAFFNETTKLQRKRLTAGGDLQFYISKRTKKRWVLIDGGYANYKYSRFPNRFSKVDLQVRGNRGGMLGAIQMKDIDEKEHSVTIAFSSSEAARLAYYHNVSGASRSRVKRKFFGLTTEEKQEIVKMLTEGVQIKFDKEDFSDI